MQIALLGIARLWPLLDARERFVLGGELNAGGEPGPKFPSVVHHLLQAYQHLVQTTTRSVPCDSDLHPGRLNHYMGVVLHVMLVSVPPDHLLGG